MGEPCRYNIKDVMLHLWVLREWDAREAEGAFPWHGGTARVQEIGPLDVRNYLEAAKGRGLPTATVKQYMAVGLCSTTPPVTRWSNSVRTADV